MKVIERREQVQRFRLCFNCLRPGPCRRTAKAGHAVYPAVEGDTTEFCTATYRRRKIERMSQMLHRQ